MPNPPLHRPATATDLVAVHAIYMHPEVVPYLGVDPASLHDFEPVFAALLAGRFIVVEKDGAVRGFYRVTRHEGRARHVATLQTLAIDPAAKGSGFAAAMVSDAIERMPAEGILRVELQVEADNPRGVAFYRKLGFELEGCLKKAYKRSGETGYVDELLMARWLGA